MNLIPFLLLTFNQQVTLPQEIHGQPGQFISIPSVTDCKSVQWVVLDAGLNLFPVELLRDTTTAVVSASSPGKFRVLAYAAKGDQASKPSITTVIIGDAPEPVQPDPENLGKLERDLKAVYKALNEAGKQEKAIKLAAIYNSLGKAVLGDEVKTAGEVLILAKEAVARVLNPSDLREIRSRLQLELQGSGFPEDPSKELDDNLRKSMSKKLMEISTVLERITK
jgi:hypothetical protein